MGGEGIVWGETRVETEEVNTGGFWGGGWAADRGGGGTTHQEVGSGPS